MSSKMKKEKTISISKKKKSSIKKTIRQGSYECIMQAIKRAQKYPIEFINHW